MLSGLKEKFSTLKINDPQKFSILTIAPEAWSVNKIAKNSAAVHRSQKKLKILELQKGFYHTTETLRSCWAQQNPFRLRLHDTSE